MVLSNQRTKGSYFHWIRKRIVEKRDDPGSLSMSRQGDMDSAFEI